MTVRSICRMISPSGAACPRVTSSATRRSTRTCERTNHVASNKGHCSRPTCGVGAETKDAAEMRMFGNDGGGRDDVDAMMPEQRDGVNLRIGQLVRSSIGWGDPCGHVGRRWATQYQVRGHVVTGARRLNSSDAMGTLSTACVVAVSTSVTQTPALSAVPLGINVGDAHTSVVYEVPAGPMPADGL